VSLPASARNLDTQKVETRCRTDSVFLIVNYCIIELPTGAILRFSNWMKAEAPNESGAPTGTLQSNQRAEKVENAAIKSHEF
jgi:hypothetical protein